MICRTNDCRTNDCRTNDCRTNDIAPKAPDFFRISVMSFPAVYSATSWPSELVAVASGRSETTDHVMLNLTCGWLYLIPHDAKLYLSLVVSQTICCRTLPVVGCIVLPYPEETVQVQLNPLPRRRYKPEVPRDIQIDNSRLILD